MKQSHPSGVTLGDTSAVDRALSSETPLLAIFNIPPDSSSKKKIDGVTNITGAIVDDAHTKEHLSSPLLQEEFETYFFSLIEGDILQCSIRDQETMKDIGLIVDRVPSPGQYYVRLIRIGSGHYILERDALQSDGSLVLTKISENMQNTKVTVYPKIQPKLKSE